MNSELEEQHFSALITTALEHQIQHGMLEGASEEPPSHQSLPRAGVARRGLNHEWEEMPKSARMLQEIREMREVMTQMMLQQQIIMKNLGLDGQDAPAFVEIADAGGIGTRTSMSRGMTSMKDSDVSPDSSSLPDMQDDDSMTQNENEMMDTSECE